MRRATPTIRRPGHPSLAPERAGGGNRSPVRRSRNIPPHHPTCHATPAKCRKNRTSPCGRVLDLAKDPYGKVTIYDDDWSDTRSDSLYDNDHLYTGRRLDTETGLYYYRARYYHAGLGTFVSRDPVGYAAGDPNLYRYVGNSPVTSVDPNGETSWDVTRKVLGWRVRKAQGLNLSALMQAKIPGLLTGFSEAGVGYSYIFFANTCELAAFSVMSGFVRAVTDKNPDVFFESVRHGGFQIGVGALHEIANYVGAGPADAKSFEGVFHTVQASGKILGAGFGAGAYLGEKDEHGGLWGGYMVGASAGIPFPPVQGGLVAWKYTLARDPVDLDDTYGRAGYCLCLALIRKMA